MAVIFITGPVRSGKSRFAENLARESGLSVSYLATAARDPLDPEWTQRIERHARDRPQHWRTIETEAMDRVSLERYLREAEADRCLLLDAVGTWLAVQIAARAADLETEYARVQEELDRIARELVLAICASEARTIVVCEQVGWDVVPIAASARLFRDVLGRMGQHLAGMSERAYLVVAGYAVDLRSVGVRVS